jgi:ribonucleoside-diphosphate reductase alpha chain
MKINRRFTKAGTSALDNVEYEKRTSRISNPDGSVVFEMNDAEIPKSWSQLATDIMVSKYFRKAGVPQKDAAGNLLRDAEGNVVTGPEKSAREVVNRLAGCWRFWGEKHGYFDTAEDAQTFYDELAHMLLHQMCAPNSPQWFNTGLNWAYGITGPAQGHFYCDPRSGELMKSKDAYSHPQPHACQPYDAMVSTPQGPISIGDIVSRNLVGLELYDGRENGRGLTRVKAVKANGQKQVFRVLLKNGASIEATADHLVWAADERRVAGQWLRIDQLTPGHRLALSTATDVTKQSSETEVIECALAGWLQGDGFVGQYAEGTNRSLTIEFMTIDEDEHAFVMRGIARVFEGIHYNVRSVESANPELTIRRIRLYGEKLRPFAEKFGLLREGADHAVPPAVRQAGRDAQCAYIRSIFQTDGTVRRRIRNSRTADIVLTTTSPGLATGVQTLLMNLGIYSRVQMGSDKRSNRQTPWYVSIGYAESRLRFREAIDFISETKIEKCRSACSDDFIGKSLPALREESIVRIELVGAKEVFDIQTESGQYLSNNIIVHNCFIQSVSDDLVNPGGIMDLWTREARLFKYGSGTGSNFSRLRGDNEPLSGGGKSSGLMSFLKIGDRAAGAIKSGGTTRRAAKMVCLDLDHPDIEQFVNWKVREELKVAAMAEGIKRLPQDQRDLAAKLNLKLDYDFNGEGYITVSGQNSNNSVRIPNRFFKSVEDDGTWNLTWRTSGKVSKTLKARELWDQIAQAAWRCADPGVQYDDTINQWHTCPKSGPIKASNPCVTGDTRVLTPGGVWRRIDQMIHLPSRVVTNLHEQTIGATEGSFPTGTKDVYELRTIGGYSVKLTADHKVWSRSRGWVEAQHLRGDDEVKLPGKPATVQEIGEPQDPKFFQLLGLFFSGANGDCDAVRLDACLGGTDLVEPLAKYVAETWCERPYDDDYVNQLMLTNIDDTGGTATAVLTNRRLLSRIKAYVRHDGGDRRLGDDAFTAGLAAQKYLIRALFTADATIANSSLELCHESQGLLQDIQMILLGFGVQSLIFTNVNGSTNTHGGLPGEPSSPLPTGARFSGSSEPANSLERTNSLELAEPRANAVTRRHGLRIDPGSLRFFEKYVGLLPGKKSEQLATAVSFAVSRGRHDAGENYDRVDSLCHLGRQQVFDLTEPASQSFIANGLTVHNCSEYMFLDDTACNLASLNVLTFFDAETRRFDIEGYKHAIRIWTIVLEISVLMASFPSEEIAARSYRYRTLGLGYANLGAMLMQAGIAYDSEKGRAICAALTAILTGESYATSAEMARELGPFPGYDSNRPEMLRVIRNHRRAAYDVSANVSAKKGIGEFEGLDIKPVGMDSSQFADNDPLASVNLLKSAQECWDRALLLGERHGYRNAQTTVIAPTGTIGLLMDCDTTGVEPDFALVKFKKLAGGGYFKIANQSLRPALVNLGYTSEQIHDMLRYVMGTLTLHDAPHVNYAALKQAGFTSDELDRIEHALPAQFEIAFAFSPWTVGAETLKRLNVSEATWKAPGFNLLLHLGFTRKQINEANDIVCGRGTVEGAPHLRQEHYDIFDCANKCGRHGLRFIAVEGHIRMMAAAQPFITGAISKTINLPNEASVQDIKSSYYLSWKLGLKANALYRDGSKLSQPLNVKSDEELDSVEDDDEENVEAARKEVADEVITAATLLFNKPVSSDNLAAAHTHVVEKIVERIVERPLRRRLPDTRHATTHKFDVGGHEGYITVGLYDDGSPGEIFIRMAKEGSTIGGLMDTIATLVSVSLQYGVPVESLVRKFEHVRFEPSGMTRNPEIPFAKSLVDYIFRWLAMEFVHGYRAANAPNRKPAQPAVEGKTVAELPEPEPASDDAPIRPAKKGPNGHGPRIDPDTAKSFPYSEAEMKEEKNRPLADPTMGSNLRLAVVADPLSQQTSELQADAPACDVCGSITVRSGTCYKCLNCGNSMGCS